MLEEPVASFPHQNLNEVKKHRRTDLISKHFQTAGKTCDKNKKNKEFSLYLSVLKTF